MLCLVESSLIHATARPPFAQPERHALGPGCLPSKPDKVSKVYTKRAAAMAGALRRELAGAIEFTESAGGLFFWARLTGAGGKVKDAGEVAKRAIEKGVAFVPGAPFYAADADMATLRLSFATADVGKILEGVGRPA